MAQPRYALKRLAQIGISSILNALMFEELRYVCWHTGRAACAPVVRPVVDVFLCFDAP